MAVTLSPKAWQSEYDAYKQRRRREGAGQSGTPSATGGPIENRPLNSPRDYAQAQGGAQDQSRASMAGQQQRDRQNMGELNNRSGGGGSNQGQQNGADGSAVEPVENKALQSPADYRKAFQEIKAKQQSGEQSTKEGLEKLGVTGASNYALWLAFGYLLTLEPIGSFLALCYLNIHWLMSHLWSQYFTPLKLWQKLTLAGMNIVYAAVILFLIIIGMLTICASQHPYKIVWDAIIGNFPNACFK